MSQNGVTPELDAELMAMLGDDPTAVPSPEVQSAFMGRLFGGILKGMGVQSEVIDIVDSPHKVLLSRLFDEIVVEVKELSGLDISELKSVETATQMYGGLSYMTQQMAFTKSAFFELLMKVNKEVMAVIQSKLDRDKLTKGPNLRRLLASEALKIVRANKKYKFIFRNFSDDEVKEIFKLFKDALSSDDSDEGLAQRRLGFDQYVAKHHMKALAVDTPIVELAAIIGIFGDFLPTKLSATFSIFSEMPGVTLEEVANFSESKKYAILTRLLNFFGECYYFFGDCIIPLLKKDLLSDYFKRYAGTKLGFEKGLDVSEIILVTGQYQLGLIKGVNRSAFFEEIFTTTLKKIIGEDISAEAIRKLATQYGIENWKIEDAEASQTAIFEGGAIVPEAPPEKMPDKFLFSDISDLERRKKLIRITLKGSRFFLGSERKSVDEVYDYLASQELSDKKLASIEEFFTTYDSQVSLKKLDVLFIIENDLEKEPQIVTQRYLTLAKRLQQISASITSLPTETCEVLYDFLSLADGELKELVVGLSRGPESVGDYSKNNALLLLVDDELLYLPSDSQAREVLEVIRKKLTGDPFTSHREVLAQKSTIDEEFATYILFARKLLTNGKIVFKDDLYTLFTLLKNQSDELKFDLLSEVFLGEENTFPRDIAFIRKLLGAYSDFDLRKLVGKIAYLQMKMAQDGINEATEFDSDVGEMISLYLDDPQDTSIDDVQLSYDFEFLGVENISRIYESYPSQKSRHKISQLSSISHVNRQELKNIILGKSPLSESQVGVLFQLCLLSKKIGLDLLVSAISQLITTQPQILEQRINTIYTQALSTFYVKNDVLGKNILEYLLTGDIKNIEAFKKSQSIDIHKVSHEVDKQLLLSIKRAQQEDIATSVKKVEVFLADIMEKFNASHLSSTLTTNSVGSGSITRRIRIFFNALKRKPHESDADYLQRVVYINWREIGGAVDVREQRLGAIAKSFPEGKYPFYEAFVVLADNIEECFQIGEEDLEDIAKAFVSIVSDSQKYLLT